MGYFLVWPLADVTLGFHGLACDPKWAFDFALQIIWPTVLRDDMSHKLTG